MLPATRNWLLTSSLLRFASLHCYAKGDIQTGTWRRCLPPIYRSLMVRPCLYLCGRHPSRHRHSKADVKRDCGASVLIAKSATQCNETRLVMRVVFGFCYTALMSGSMLLLLLSKNCRILELRDAGVPVVVSYCWQLGICASSFACCKTTLLYGVRLLVVERLFACLTLEQCN